MSHTIRKKCFLTKSQLNIEYRNRCQIEFNRYTRWKLEIGSITLDQIQYETIQRAKRWKLAVTSDNRSQYWRPWTQNFKQRTARKSRSYARSELRKSYLDWDHDFVDIKYQRFDNVWNWD